MSESFVGHPATPCPDCGELTCRCEGSRRWIATVATLRQQLAEARAENAKWQAMADTAGFAFDGLLAIGNELNRLRAAESALSSLREGVEGLRTYQPKGCDVRDRFVLQPDVLALFDGYLIERPSPGATDGG